MTEELSTLIAQVRELDAKATAGPWIADEHGTSPYVWARELQEILVAKTWHDDADQGAHNRDFIALSRTAAPILAREVQRLAAFEAECERLREDARNDIAYSANAETVWDDRLAVARAEASRLREQVKGLPELLSALQEDYAHPWSGNEHFLDRMHREKVLERITAALARLEEWK